MTEQAGPDDEKERLSELEALQSIFPELQILEISDPTPGIANHVCLHIAVEPSPPVKIELPVSSGGVRSTAESTNKVFDIETQSLASLPSLQVDLFLPLDYPSNRPPVVKVTTETSWLPPLITKDLEARCAFLWEEQGRGQILFTYLDQVEEEARTAFNISQPLNVSSDQIVVLLDNNLRNQYQKFSNETFNCDICLEPRKGAVCHRFQRCTHVFCTQCLIECYTNSIVEGDVTSVRCLQPKCDTHNTTSNKIDPTLEPSELIEISLPQDLVQRYITLKRKRRVECDKNTIYCPRSWCQGPTRTNAAAAAAVIALLTPVPASSPNPTAKSSLPAPADRLAICLDCAFAFCIVCKASWHGEYLTCFPRAQFELTAEERASEDYLRLHTQACPTCDARAQKTHGCNHMICFKCDTHFCYLCGSYLQRENPYEHFNSRKTGCYMRLWELEEGDEGGGINYAGGAAEVIEDEVEFAVNNRVGGPDPIGHMVAGLELDDTEDMQGVDADRHIAMLLQNVALEARADDLQPGPVLEQRAPRRRRYHGRAGAG